MLTTAQLWINGFLAFIVLPMELYSIFKGRAPRGGVLGKYHTAEPMLVHAESAFVIAVCLGSVVLMARHFSWLGADVAAPAMTIFNGAFVAAFVVFLALLIRAAMKIRSASAGGA